jgi:antitoxin CptB
MTAGDEGAMMDAGGTGRLRWRCRRGMRELDIVLVRYLETDYPAATAPERAAFRDLLEWQDPELNALLLGQLEPRGEALVRVVERLRRGS